MVDRSLPAEPSHFTSKNRPTDPTWTDLDRVWIPGLDDRVAWLMRVEV
jgi:hypothetical protein